MNATRKQFYRKLSKTVKHRFNKEISGKIEGKKEGWRIVNIWGEPYDRGYAHGFLLKRELDEVFRVFPFVVKRELQTPFSEYVRTSNQMIYPVVKASFPEYYEEILGIVAGYKKAGGTKSITVKRLIAWNAYMSLFSLYHQGGSERCSAFIATGSATKSGEIIMGHNTHSDFVSGSLFNIILKVTPPEGSGHAFRMQTAAGLISSIVDWFVCANGIIGCESTISAINYSPEFGYPSFCRIRQVMQYADSLDKAVEIMLDHNSGDYACSWLFGDIRTGEIMRFELGQKYHNSERTTNGFFYGMNSAVDYNIRNLETNDTNNTDIATSSGSRSYRLHHLLTAQKIDEQYGKEILSDHYDEYLNEYKRSSRGICRHTELDGTHTGKREGFYPFGTLDGKIVTSALAKEMAFLGRWGSSCGRIFHPQTFIKENPEYKDFSDYLPEFPKNRWTPL